MILELDYNKGKFVLNSTYDRNEIKKGKFIPLLDTSNPYGSLLEIKEKYNLVNYFPRLNKIEIDTINFYPDGAYSEPNMYKKINEDFRNNKNYEIFKNIVDNHSDIWFTDEVKKLRLNWKILDLMNNSISLSMPKINLFKVNRAKAKIYLKASNSNGFSDYSELYSIDITHKWNSAFVSIISEKKDKQSKNQKTYCDVTANINQTEICMPKIKGLTNISKNKNYDSFTVVYDKDF